MKPEVIVVGGGMAGLAAAAYLARAGKKTLLLERARTLGGRGGSTTRAGYVFGQGLHALYRGGAAEEVLGELDVAIDGAAAPATGALLLRSGTLHSMPVGFVTLMSTELLSFREKVAAARALYHLDRAPVDSVPDEPLPGFVDSLTEEPRVREVVLAMLGLATYTRNADLVSARRAVTQLRRASHAGVSYLHGGWAPLVEGLRSAAIRAGVEIRTATGATEIVHDARIHAVIAGERIECEDVVLAVSPSTARALAPRARLWDRAPVPMHASCLDVALSELPIEKHRFVVGVDERVFFNVQSQIARLAPDGGAVASVVEYLRPDEAGERGRLEDVLDRVQPGWRDRVVATQFLPKIAVSFAHPEAGRVASTETDVVGLYVAGDWASDDQLADGALGSARQAAHHCVLRHHDRSHEARVA